MFMPKQLSGDGHLDAVEARALLTTLLGRYRTLPYTELSDRATFTHVDSEEETAPSGTRYRKQAVCMWDDEGQDAVVVIGFVFAPNGDDSVSDELLITPVDPPLPPLQPPPTQ